MLAARFLVYRPEHLTTSVGTLPYIVDPHPKQQCAVCCVRRTMDQFTFACTVTTSSIDRPLQRCPFPACIRHHTPQELLAVPSIRIPGGALTPYEWQLFNR